MKRHKKGTHLDYPGYTLEHFFRSRAGVCVYARNDLCIQRLRYLEDPTFSCLWVLVDTGNEEILYSCVYRSHSGDQETTRLFEYLGEAADMALHLYPSAQLAFLGDFNACHQDWLYPYQKTDHAVREARNFALSLDLFQLVLGDHMALGEYGNTSQQIGMRCGTSLHLILGGRSASLL